MTSLLDKALESGLVPEPIIRSGIRRLLARKIEQEKLESVEARQARLMAFVEELKKAPIAIETDTANEQHYEVPTEFYNLVLGPRKKYSSGLWKNDTDSFEESENNMLALYCERADIQPGQRVLDLGCGWGSVSLYLAEHYPDCQITGLSNSKTQKEYIDGTAKEKGFENLEIVTGNVVDFEFEANRFDRVISVEMFEHMKNYQQLLAKISRWLTAEGQLFVHIFTHNTFAYHYEDKDGTDWMTRYFFSGGTMPSNDLLHYFQDDLTLVNQWCVNGTHYQKTSEAWLDNMKRHRQEILPILASTYGEKNVTKWWVYWQVFFLACAELWGYDNGNEWLVSHYLFKNKKYT